VALILRGTSEDGAVVNEVCSIIGRRWVLHSTTYPLSRRIMPPAWSNLDPRLSLMLPKKSGVHQV